MEAILATSLLPAGAAAGTVAQEQMARVRLNSPGLHLGMNAAAAAAVAVTLGVPLSQAVAHMAEYEPVGMRMRLERIAVGGREEGLDGVDVAAGGSFDSSNSESKDDGGNSSGGGSSSNNDGCIVLLNDAYNANPLSVAAALQQLAGMQPGSSSSSNGSSVCDPQLRAGRRIAVLGDMRELGSQTAAEHRRAIETAAWLGIDELLLVGPCFLQALTALAPSRPAGGEEEREGDALSVLSSETHSQPPATDPVPQMLYLAQRTNVSPDTAAAAGVAAAGSGYGDSDHGMAVCLFASVDELVGSPAVRRIAAGDVVLVKGSRAMRMERVRDALLALHEGEQGRLGVK